MAKAKTAFIGTGIMGAPMAGNLLKAGYELNIHTRTKSKAKALLDEGAGWFDSPAEAVEGVDFVITCLPDTPDVEDVLLGSGGVIEAARPGLICIDTSTISPEFTKELSQKLREKGSHLLDAPISGGQVGAQNATLSIMVGGSREIFDKALPMLEAVGRTITYCGQSGSGQLTKLVNQVMVIHTIMSISEGLAFAEKAGLDLETTLKVTSGGAAQSHSLVNLGPKIIKGDLGPAFMVDLQLKDLRLVAEYAARIGQPLPGTALAKELLSTLQAWGRGRDGTQALVDVIRKLGGAGS